MRFPTRALWWLAFLPISAAQGCAASDADVRERQAQEMIQWLQDRKQNVEYVLGMADEPAPHYVLPDGPPTEEELQQMRPSMLLHREAYSRTIGFLKSIEDFSESYEPQLIAASLFELSEPEDVSRRGLALWWVESVPPVTSRVRGLFLRFPDGVERRFPNVIHLAGRDKYRSEKLAAWEAHQINLLGEEENVAEDSNSDARPRKGREISVPLQRDLLRKLLDSKPGEIRVGLFLADGSRSNTVPLTGFKALVGVRFNQRIPLDGD